MGSTGCLILHGFAGERYETEPLRKFLKRNGYEVCCPVLAGYKKKRRDLARTSYKEWIKSAQDVYDQLKLKCDKIIIFGFSMGGLIGANLVENNQPLAIVTLSTPIYCFDLKVALSNVISDIANRRYYFTKKYVAYMRNSPIRTFVNFCIMLQKTKRLFGKITVPCLVIQGKQDDAAKWSSAEYIYSHVKSEKKELKYYEDAPHLICCYRNSRQVFDDILNFIKAVDNGS